MYVCMSLCMQEPCPYYSPHFFMIFIYIILYYVLQQIWNINKVSRTGNKREEWGTGVSHH